MIPAGILDKRITILAPPTERDEAGEIMGDWPTVTIVWASITEISGREFLAADVTQNEVEVKIRIRYRPGIVPGMNVRHGDREYNIKAALDVSGRREDLLLMCCRLD
jgi:SPP1 family predicted phage head-tail adaptor